MGNKIDLPKGFILQVCTTVYEEIMKKFHIIALLPSKKCFGGKLLMVFK